MSVEMTEEIKVKVIEYLQTFEAGIKKAGEFSAEQAPLVVQEFLAWEFWSNSTIACASLIALITLSVVIWKVTPRLDEYDAFPTRLFGSFAAVGLLILTIASAHDAGKAAIAPRLVVLEKITSLMK